jgi:peptidoglycan/LPS O-acetylase OafA/YrhL
LLRYFYNKYTDWIHRREKLLLGIGLFGFIFLNILRVPLGITVEQTPGFMIIFYLAIHSIGICCIIPYLVSMKMKSKVGVQFFTTISLISYSLYLLHYTIILHSLKTIFPSEELRGVSLWLYTFLYWGITILLSYLLYKYFERPLTNLRDSPRLLKFLGYSKN